MTPARGRWQKPRWNVVLALSVALIGHIGLLLSVREALRWRPTAVAPMAMPMQLRLIDVQVLPPPDSTPAPEPAPEPSPPLEQAPTAFAVAPPARPIEPATPAADLAASTNRSTASVPTVAAAMPKPSVDIAAAMTAAALSADLAVRGQDRLPTEIPMLASAVPVTVAPSPVAATAPAASPLPRERQPRLVTPNGRVLLPEVDLSVAVAAARFPSKPAQRAAGSSDPFSRRSPIPYVATRFDALWVPDGETLVDGWLRKLADKLVKKSSTEVAGLQIDCVWILVVAGCTWGVPPRISIDELKRMRADIPMPRGPGTQPGG